MAGNGSGDGQAKVVGLGHNVPSTAKYLEKELVSLMTFIKEILLVLVPIGKGNWLMVVHRHG